MCGADLESTMSRMAWRGSPPRVRSRLMSGLVENIGGGITSACAEQTSNFIRPSGCMRDHLRVCGADCDDGVASAQIRGSPPRVRSRQNGRDSSNVALGITSACAEADPQAGPRTIPIQGSPPRVRSRRACRCARRAHGRITSACAEQTGSFGSRPMSIRDHLRVCGADPTRTRARSPPSGSPPRVRSRQRPERLVGDLRGITSACAEQTRSR